ncbi:MAG: ROK family transcriptional regulator [Propionibacteriaceae bacterium]|nr:ROK family transcriptional regulator [Propionibacteriaceae bacterium]
MAASPPHLGLEGLTRDLAIAILLDGPVSRAELARRHDLTPGTVTRLVTPLLKAGLVLEAEAPDGPRRGLGRPSKPLSIAAGTHLFAGLKLTGASVSGVLVDMSAHVLATGQIELVGRDPQAVVARIEALVADLAGGRALAAVGIGLGGNVGPDDVVQRAPFLGWQNVPLGDLVGARLGVPVALANDVAGLTEAQHWFGAGRGLDSFALITMGVGVGYGLVSGGHRVETPDYGIGLIGHMRLDPNGPRCAQGHTGCAAALLSDAGIEASVAAGLGRPVSFDECLDLALDGNPVASSVVSASGRALGRLVAAVANIALPERVILSGESARLAEVAARDVAAGLQEDRDPLADEVDYVVQPSDPFDWARGAAVIALQRVLLA